MTTRNTEKTRLRFHLAGLVVSGLLLTAGAAAAIFVGPCNGSVKIDGTTYTPENDSPANPIVIPEKEGLGVVVGPGTIYLATWDGENANDEVESTGEFEQSVEPVGIWSSADSRTSPR